MTRLPPQAVLGSAGIGYVMRPAATVRIENRPGIGAPTFAKLADAGVNVTCCAGSRILTCCSSP